ncbi:MAG TPA: nascent polypeptide-associated complex protein [Candidatus Aenigmarchaeota archaeon]|nr:MAG: nascent polypeptide-associated complex protein [Candidatus Aenigmarchaeota archaeon]HDD45980.1 nascent polypeptide-associated complex protein [Candidatus Aenigmarchaeota archaeon]
MKINQRNIERMMKQMGMQMSTLDVEEVIIKTKASEILIKNPEVAKIRIMGKEMFQISGDVEERKRIDEGDIEMVANQANVSKDEAKKALEEANGDIALAIMKLKGE